jgi:hypothetical protein
VELRSATARALPLALAALFGMVLLMADLPWWGTVLGFAALGAIAFAYAAVRELKSHVRVRQHAALGDPDAILAITKAELDRRRTPRSRLPFVIYQANALQMKGEWEESLGLLERARLEAVGGKARRHWEFLHAHSLLGALLHTGEVEQARELLAGRIEPMARRLPEPLATLSVDEANARIDFFTGKLEHSKGRFEQLIADERIPASSRGMYHYYLARIARAQDRPGEAEEHAATAAKLAPRTFAARAAAD